MQNNNKKVLDDEICKAPTILFFVNEIISTAYYHNFISHYRFGDESYKNIGTCDSTYIHNLNNKIIYYNFNTRHRSDFKFRFKNSFKQNLKIRINKLLER